MSQEPLFAIDSGTTNTRAWVLRGEEVLGRGRAAAGVRDTARTGSDEFLKDGVRRALAAALEESSLSEAPRAAVAAGMITSELGLAEVPHLEAPVGWENLSEAVERVEFPDLGGLAVHFVRGVRSGPESPSAETAPTADIIRGEETELFGALEMLSLSGPLVYVHLGSHTKAIRVDASDRIAGGITTLAGELMHTVRTQTILSGALSAEPTGDYDGAMLEKGAEWAAEHGLSRTFFLMRIFGRGGGASRGDLEGIFAGAVAAEDVRAMRSAGLVGGDVRTAVLSGVPALQPAWRHFLEAAGAEVTVLSAEDTERAFLAGLGKIVLASDAFSSAP